MQYIEFTVIGYRGIVEPMTLNVEKHRIIPIVGINECGKTTILEAIFAFDYHNDKENNGKHLKDVENLFSFKPSMPAVSALIELDEIDFEFFITELKQHYTSAEIKYIVTSFPNEFPNGIEDDEELHQFNVLDHSVTIKTQQKTVPESLSSFLSKQKQNQCSQLLEKHQKKLPRHIQITRDLRDKSYSCDWKLINRELQNLFCQTVISGLGYILYFDDFRHAVPREIEITGSDETDWKRILRSLFKGTDKDLELDELPDMEERRRRSAIAAAQRHLNSRLTEQWQRFHLDEKTDSLRINLDYRIENSELQDERHFIQFKVVEKTEKQHEFFFDIHDRSKGFFWFFNFVMRLEFNPKSVDLLASECIYLLDEPGSYLHASAQSQLCRKLKEISNDNPVIYCTHSHHLLEPNTIPFGNIHIADKNSSGEISLAPVHEIKSATHMKASAFQPIIEALQLGHTLFEFGKTKAIVVEGIYDFFAFSMFSDDSSTAVIPAVGANSIRYLVSLLLASGSDFRCVWDNDPEGIENEKLASEHFGAIVAQKHFRLLPTTGNKQKKMILQNLFHSEDIKLIKTKLSLPDNSSFKRVLQSIFYSQNRDDVVRKLKNTRKRFADTIKAIWEATK